MNDSIRAMYVAAATCADTAEVLSAAWLKGDEEEQEQEEDEFRGIFQKK